MADADDRRYEQWREQSVRSHNRVIMPNNWNSKVYRQRADEWQEKANALSPGKERDTCLTIAQGYARLAALIDESERPQTIPPPD
jgi:hypothetical protein